MAVNSRRLAREAHLLVGVVMPPLPRCAAVAATAFIACAVVACEGARLHEKHENVAVAKAGRQTEGHGQGGMTLAIYYLKKAVVKSPFAVAMGIDKAEKVLKTELLYSMDNLAKFCDRLGRNMGFYLRTNIGKCRRSQATAKKEESLQPWLLSEVYVHEYTRYRRYIEESACMGSQWIGWLLEFAVESVALIAGGKEPRAALQQAYGSTLAPHHGRVARAAFRAGLTRAPSREGFLDAVRNSNRGQPLMSEAEAIKELEEFVFWGRPAYRYIAQAQREVKKKMQEKRAEIAGGGRRWWGWRQPQTNAKELQVPEPLPGAAKKMIRSRAMRS